MTWTMLTKLALMFFRITTCHLNLNHKHDDLIDLKGFMILFLISGRGKSIIVVYTKLPMLVIDDSYENIKLTKFWGIMVNELYDG
jgi:hypothetical protein